MFNIFKSLSRRGSRVSEQSSIEKLEESQQTSDSKPAQGLDVEKGHQNRLIESVVHIVEKAELGKVRRKSCQKIEQESTIEEVERNERRSTGSKATKKQITDKKECPGGSSPNREQQIPILLTKTSDLLEEDPNASTPRTLIIGPPTPLIACQSEDAWQIFKGEELLREPLRPRKASHNSTNSRSTSSSDMRDLNQLTTLEAFGVNIPTLSQADGSDMNLRTRSGSSSGSSFAAKRNRRHSMIESTSFVQEKSQMDKNIELMMTISMSQSGMINPLECSMLENITSTTSKGILKNLDTGEPPNSASTLPPGVRRPSLQMDNNRNRSAEYRDSEVNKDQGSRQSIMAAFSGKPEEDDLNTLPQEEKEVLAEETPKFESMLRLKMKAKRFKGGEFIIRKHDMGNEMFLVVSGKVEILSTDGKQRYSVVLPGSFFGKSNGTSLYSGEMGVLFNIPR